MENSNNWQPPRIGEKQPNEVTAYTVAIGNISLNPLYAKKQKQALGYIQSLKGFIGFYPSYPNGTLCIFKTENDAKVAKNQMDAKGIQTGKNIGEVFVGKEYVEDAERRKNDKV